MKKASGRELILDAFEGAGQLRAGGDNPQGEQNYFCIPNVKILGYESIHNREYTQECMDQAVQEKVYEGVRIYEDHQYPDKDTPPGFAKSRKTRDCLGFVKNVKHVNGDGLRGDAYFTVKDKLTSSVYEASKLNPRMYGFSHDHDFEKSSHPNT